MWEENNVRPVLATVPEPKPELSIFLISWRKDIQKAGTGRGARDRSRKLTSPLPRTELAKAHSVTLAMHSVDWEGRGGSGGEW